MSDLVDTHARHLAKRAALDARFSRGAVGDDPDIATVWNPGEYATYAPARGAPSTRDPYESAANRAFAANMIVAYIVPGAYDGPRRMMPGADSVGGYSGTASIIDLVIPFRSGARPNLNGFAIWQDEQMGWVVYSLDDLVAFSRLIS